jgi:uncharacterized protein
MTNFLPIFPLPVVVFPEEVLNLHIFEPRYVQLINECRLSNKPFAMLTVINQQVQEVGTLVQLHELIRVYEGAEMDVRVKAINRIRVLEQIPNVPEKKYAGAIANHLPQTNNNGQEKKMQRILQEIDELFAAISIEKFFKKPISEITCYDVAHHAGLSLAEEYELLCLESELERQNYLLYHLTTKNPLKHSLTELKSRVKLNGHFRVLK